MDPNFASLLLESMTDGVFTLNNKGIISSWNPSMERITGYSAKEAVGKSGISPLNRRQINRLIPGQVLCHTS
ncbi:MAG: PAS domain-containing protein [Desulfobacterales bacterium]